ncbi:MAG: tetratricopeptide repeat protein, partial [Pirellulaceae bacterium]
MAIRSTVIRRVLLLLLIGALLLGGLASAYAYRKWQRNQEALEQRQIGMRAFDAGDYQTALTSLNTYLKRYTEDLEALDKLAKARLEVVEPRGQHIGQAMSVLRRILYLDAKNPYARDKLLELYTLTGMNTEGIQLADDVLKDNPKNTVALRAKTLALARLLRFDEALPYAEAYAEQKPLDLEMQTLLFEVAFRVNQSVDELIKRAETLRTENPDDPRWELLQAYAYRYANDRKNVLRWLEKASSKPPPDDTYVGRLVELLDQVGLYTRALSVLEEAANRGDNAGIEQELIQRLWEHGRYKEVADRFQREKVDLDKANADLIALAARSLYRLKQPDDARRLVDALAARKQETKAQAWAGVLTALHGGKQQSAMRVIEQCKTALQKDPKNAFFEAILGAAYRQLGEDQLALEHWRRATTLRPVWGAPHLRLARISLASGRAKEARLHAQRAVTLMPNSIETVVTWALARAANLQRLGSESPEKLLVFVDQINRAAPEEQRLLPLEISLLVQTGAKEKAARKLTELLERKKPLQQTVLKQLANVSRKYSLGVEKQYAEKIASIYGVSPDQVLAEALRIASEKRPEEGQQWLEEKSRAGTTTNALAWRVVHARFLNATGSPRAKDAWATLMRDEKDNLPILRQALRSRAVQSDKQLAKQAIDRLRELVGEEGTVWRLEEARWLLLNADSERDTADAIAILEKLLAETPSSLEARLLLARSLLRMGATQRAIRELTVVADAQLESIPIALELASYHQLQGDFDKARNLLSRVLNNRVATTAARFRVSQMLAAQGDPQDDARAIAILESLDAAQQTKDGNPQLLLAQLYVRQGEQANANKICESLLKNPSLQGVRFSIAY